DQLLICDREAGCSDLLGQVEGSDYAPSCGDWDAEERAHVWVAFRPPAGEAPVVVDVRRAKRLRRLQHRAKHPVRSRQVAKRRHQPIAHAGGEKAAEAALAVGSAERGVAGAGELARALHEALKDLLDGPLGRDGQHGVAHGSQGWAQFVGHTVKIRIESALEARPNSKQRCINSSDQRRSCRPLWSPSPAFETPKANIPAPKEVHHGTCRLSPANRRFSGAREGTLEMAGGGARSRPWTVDGPACSRSCFARNASRSTSAAVGRYGSISSRSPASVSAACSSPSTSASSTGPVRGGRS